MPLSSIPQPTRVTTATPSAGKSRKRARCRIFRHRPTSDGKLLLAVSLSQSQRHRANVWTPEGLSQERDAIRPTRRLLPRRSLPCRNRQLLGVIAESSRKSTLRVVAQPCCHEKRLDNRITQQKKPLFFNQRLKCCLNERFHNTLTIRDLRLRVRFMEDSAMTPTGLWGRSPTKPTNRHIDRSVQL